jgi:hypothetical protein
MMATVSLLLARGPSTGEPARDPAPLWTPYAGAWQYRWGDSPQLPNGKLQWAQPESAALGWQPDVMPNKEPPGRNGQHFLWLRSRNPGKSRRQRH